MFLLIISKMSIIHVKKNLKPKLTPDILSLNKSQAKSSIQNLNFWEKKKKLEKYVIFEDL